MPISISHSPALRLASTLFATLFIAFGINAILRPNSALQFFNLQLPTPFPITSTTSLTSLASATDTIKTLTTIYGARDIFIGVAIYAAATFGSRRTLGWLLVAGGGVAGVDGAVVRFSGGGGGGGGGGAEWNHWGYAPVLVGVGALVLGVLG